MAEIGRYGIGGDLMSYVDGLMLLVVIVFIVAVQIMAEHIKGVPTDEDVRQYELEREMERQRSVDRRNVGKAGPVSKGDQQRSRPGLAQRDSDGADASSVV